jgi:hypothetical protein
MTIAMTVAGVVLISLVVHDVFTVLFRPGAVGRFSGGLVRAVWTLLRHSHSRRAMALAGPVALAAVASFWATLLVLGWTLIYLPHYPQDFIIGGGVEPPLVGALHVSLATLTTLGSSSAAPRVAWLQIVSPLEALIGFGLLTAAVAYLLQLYPVLSRRRSLAYEIHLLVDAERKLGVVVPEMEPGAASQLYGELASRLIAVDQDLVKFPIAYYFAESDPRFALSAVLPELVDLADRGVQAVNSNSVRLRASMLEEAIGDFARTVAMRFLSGEDHTTAEVLDAFGRDHLHGQHGGVPGADGRAPGARQISRPSADSPAVQAERAIGTRVQR